jgi:hypothetical protein
MWGILPFGSSILAILMVLLPEKKRDEMRTTHSVVRDEELVARRMVS